MRHYVSAVCLAFLLCVEVESQQVAPGADLIPPTEDWSFNETWLPVTKGNRAFHYMTHYGTSELEVYSNEMQTTRRKRKPPQPGVIPFPP